MACDLPTYDICIQEGTDYTLVLSLTDDNDAPLDLTGAIPTLNIRLINVTTPYIGTANGNSLTFTIPETEVFTAYHGIYQVDYTLGADTNRVIRGNVDIEKAL